LGRKEDARWTCILDRPLGSKSLDDLFNLIPVDLSHPIGSSGMIYSKPSFSRKWIASRIGVREMPIYSAERDSTKMAPSGIWLFKISCLRWL
jgi:hypothetical protein